MLMCKKKIKKEYFIRENDFSVEEPYDRIEVWWDEEFLEAKALPSSKSKMFCDFLDSKGFKKLTKDPFSEETKKKKVIKAFFSGFLDFFSYIKSIILACTFIALILFPGYLMMQYSLWYGLLYLIMIPTILGIDKVIPVLEQENRSEIISFKNDILILLSDREGWEILIKEM